MTRGFFRMRFIYAYNYIMYDHASIEKRKWKADRLLVVKPSDIE
jgi:hypothetical protein